MFIPLNKNPYTPNTQGGNPAQANQTVGKGFFSAPVRTYSGDLVRAVSPTFQDVWSQPRLFYNSLVPQEKQFLIDAIRFETSNVKSQVIRANVVAQLNKVDNDLAKRVARVIGVPEPTPDPTYYHNNQTVNVGSFGQPLRKVDGFKVGVLATVANPAAISQAAALRDSFASSQVDVVVVAERYADGVDLTYTAADAISFDAIVVAHGAERLFVPTSITSPPMNSSQATWYPAGRPLQILLDGFRFGRTVGAWGSGSAALAAAQISSSRPGVYVASKADSNWVNGVLEGLRTWKFLDRFAVELGN